MNNKGILFSVMVVFLISPLVLLTVSHTEVMRGYGAKIGEIVRSKSGFFFLKSIDQDLERGIQIVGKRSMTSAVNYVISEGKGLNNSEKTLKELFKNGTINGEEVSLMNKTTIYNWKKEVKDLSSKRGFIVNISFNDVEIGMGNSYNVLFSLNYSLRLTDKNEVFFFAKDYTKNILVPIEGLEDPLFSLNTGGKISLPIERSPYSSFTNQITTGSGGNGFSGGQSIVIEDISDIQNRGEKILVTSDVSDTDVNDFSGVIFESNSTPIDIPYIQNDNATDIIPNKTRIAVLGNESEVWNISNLYKTWQNQLYVSGRGPSFLDRLEGSLSNSYPGKGIETFVRKDKLKGWGIEPKERSNIGFVYFDNNTVNDYHVKGMEDSFLIDNKTYGGETHTEAYGLEELTY